MERGTVLCPHLILSYRFTFTHLFFLSHPRSFYSSPFSWFFRLDLRNIEARRRSSQHLFRLRPRYRKEGTTRHRYQLHAFRSHVRSVQSPFLPIVATRYGCPVDHFYGHWHVCVRARLHGMDEVSYQVLCLRRV